MDLGEAGEREDFERALAALERVGVRPKGHRSALWEASWGTPALVAEYGLEYDSTLMDDDRPYLLEEDRTPGIHDMLCAACDPERYTGLGVEGWHASCRENLERAMAELGHPGIEIPQPINLFMNIPVSGGGELGWEPAPTKPGDFVTLRAEMDCFVVVSACPQDIVPINDRRPGPVAIELLDG